MNNKFQKKNSVNQLPEIWLDYVKKSGFWQHYFFWEAWLILKLLPDKDLLNIKILEAGCGHGIVGCLLALMGSRVSLLDYDMKVLLRARKSAKYFGLDEKINYVKGDVYLIPFKKEFDLVWNDGVIEHFEKPEDIIKLMAKKTKKDGWVIVTVPAKWTLHTLIVRPWRRYIRKNYEFDIWGKEKSFSETELKLLMQKAGLRDVTTVTCDLRRAFLDDYLVSPFRKIRGANLVLSGLTRLIDKMEFTVPYINKLGFIVGGIGRVDDM